MGLRACELYATSWTYVALLVRLGTALGLGHERSQAYSVIDLELRRRLCYCIGILDSQSSLDRGTPPLVHSTSLGPLPMNVNDNDLTGSPQPRDRRELTQMSYSLMMFETMLCHLRICEAGADSGCAWETKLKIVTDFVDDFQTQYVANNSCETPVQKLMFLAADNLTVNMHILLRRPPYRQGNNVPSTDDFNILDCATRTLEGQLAAKLPELSPWAWKKWPPWYSLAIVLTELLKSDDMEATEDCYRTALAVHREFARPLNDSESGILWKPITKLLRSVKDHRASRTGTPSSSSSVLTPEARVGAKYKDLPTLVNGMSTMWNDSGKAQGSTVNGSNDMSLYDQLNPINGISWLDWDEIMNDDINGYAQDWTSNTSNPVT